MDKNKLRIRLQERLRAIPSDQRGQRSKRACQNLISTVQFQDALAIMMYLSLPYEVDTTDAILHAWQLGKIVVVPKIAWEQKSMIPVRINSLEIDFSTDVAGLRNPVDGIPMPFKEIDLVVTPALGFDKKGERLGRGSSYYDRFFANKELKAYRCGLAFAEQLIDSIPVAWHDEPMDFLVTDEEVMYFNHR